MKLFKFLRLIRVHQWIKNVFVFVPLLFSLHLFDEAYFLTTLYAFMVFCLASSAIYVINDLVDIESDRAHPVKKNRPLPSGAISKTTAVVTSSLFLVLVFWMMMYFNKEFIFFREKFVCLQQPLDLHFVAHRFFHCIFCAAKIPSVAKLIEQFWIFCTIHAAWSKRSE